jgi:hypothetical protein
VGAPKFSVEEKKFAKEIAATFPEGQKQRVLRDYNVPEIEKAMKVDLIEYISPPKDVGEVSAKVPTAQCLTCTFVPGSALHTWQVTATSGMSIGHKSMLVASKTLALTIIDLLLKPDILRRAKFEFKKTEIKGSPSTIMISAILPGSIVPIFLPNPQALAPFAVAATIASIGVKPQYFTNSSNSMARAQF